MNTSVYLITRGRWPMRGKNMTPSLVAVLSRFCHKFQLRTVSTRAASRHIGNTMLALTDNQLWQLGDVGGDAPRSLDHRSARWSALGIAQGNARVGVQSGLAEQQLMTLWVTPALGLTLLPNRRA